MAENIVIAVNVNGETIQNPGVFTIFHSKAIKFFHMIFKKCHSAPALPPPPPPELVAAVAVAPAEEEKIPKSTHDSSTVTPSPNRLPNNIPGKQFAQSSVRRRNPVPQTMWPLHPVIMMIHEQELGKSVFNLGAPITIALLITNGGKSQTILVHFVLTGLSTGCIAIWNGIALRGAFPKTANVVEQIGIIMVLMSFNGLVASALPMEFAWIPILCCGLCVLPFAIAALPLDAATYDTADGG